MNRRSAILATVMVSLAAGALAFIAISMTHAPGVQASVSYQSATTTTPVGTTTTPVGTTTAVVPTSTPVSLAAYPALAPVSHFTASRHGSTVRFSWHTTSRVGFKGFRVYASAHQLTRSLIRAHYKLSYRYTAHWSGAGPFMLHVVLPGGQQLVVPTS